MYGSSIAGATFWTWYQIAALRRQVVPLEVVGSGWEAADGPGRAVGLGPVQEPAVARPACCRS